MLRSLFWLAGVVLVLWIAARLPLGPRSLGEHVRRIWATPEAAELRKELKAEEQRARKELMQRLGPTPAGDKPAPLPEPQAKVPAAPEVKAAAR